MAFIVSIKSITTTDGGKWGGGKSKRIYRTSKYIRIVHGFLESAVSILSLAGSHSPPHLHRLPSYTG